MTEIEIYAKCLSLGMTPAGAAGATANIMAESAGRPNNVEDRSGLDDETYTRNVDNGSYRNFATDAFGYGLVQLTAMSRKQAYLDYAKGHGKSIGDADTQFQFIGREMRSDYPYVWNRLTSTDDPYEAGYVFCKFYAIPADTERQAQHRGQQAKQIYQRCSGTAPAKSDKDVVSDVTKDTMWPPRMIDKGMNGSDVMVLQAVLSARGYTVGAVNGVFGESLDKAVRSFQRDNGLAMDGVVGPMTWSALLKR